MADQHSAGAKLMPVRAALRWAHQVCAWLQEGETPTQVNRQFQAETHSSPADVAQFVSSAMLAYPDCA